MPVTLTTAPQPPARHRPAQRPHPRPSRNQARSLQLGLLKLRSRRGMLGPKSYVTVSLEQDTQTQRHREETAGTLDQTLAGGGGPGSRASEPRRNQPW